MEIFNPDTGLPVLLRALHVLAGVTWIGLLYYFNVVQVPSFAAYGEEGKARNISIDKLARRALWWFRWASIVTLGFGLLLVGMPDADGNSYMKDFMSGNGANSLPKNAAIFVGMILGITMAANVWMVIWKNQKVVLAKCCQCVRRW